jgi:hypothetical protein
MAERGKTTPDRIRHGSAGAGRAAQPPQNIQRIGLIELAGSVF